MYVCCPLSLQNAGGLLHERGIDISHETVRCWWNFFGPVFAAEIRQKRVNQMRAYSNSQWHLDEVFVEINGEWYYRWRAVDHKGEGRDARVGSQSRLPQMGFQPTGRHNEFNSLSSGEGSLPVASAPPFIRG